MNRISQLYVDGMKGENISLQMSQALRATGFLGILMRLSDWIFCWEVFLLIIKYFRGREKFLF